MLYKKTHTFFKLTLTKSIVPGYRFFRFTRFLELLSKSMYKICHYSPLQSVITSSLSVYKYFKLLSFLT